MRAVTALIGLALILVVLWDAFETIVLPRRVTRKLRLTRLFYRVTWLPWSAMARRITHKKRRETYLSFYGPLSLLGLLITWALGLVVGFALLQWAAGPLADEPGGLAGFRKNLYFSGATLFTLGSGQTPGNSLSRFLLVAEAGTGLGFLAIVIGYLPVIYQAFSRREVNISLLDARAGSPPSAAELLRRHSSNNALNHLQDLLAAWERWSAELMESHLSYPVLAYFRSQHNNQSWLAALTTILDTSALVMAGVEGSCARQAELTFAIARHAVVDLAQVFVDRPRRTYKDRLPTAEFQRLREVLARSRLRICEGDLVPQKLAEIRRGYEPYVQSLSEFLVIELPPWLVESRRKDNWQTSSWEATTEAKHF